MAGEKIQQLNHAIEDALPAMQAVARENPEAKVLVRAVAFSSGAEWHVADPTPVEDFKWSELQADGVTDLGHALMLVSEQLRIPPMDERALPPVLVVVSDGQPTDDWEVALTQLMSERWGQKSVRLAIAIGGDADLDVLQQFIGHDEIKPLIAKNAEQLVGNIRWVSTAALKAASAPPSQTGDDQRGTNVPLPQQPQYADTGDATDVW
jgi:uncharacterized protein YegL